jgi:hypothetical protein
MRKEHKIWWEELAEIYRNYPEEYEGDMWAYSCDNITRFHEGELGFAKQHWNTPNDLYEVLQAIWATEYGNTSDPLDNLDVDNLTTAREAFVQDMADIIERNVA